MNEEEKNVSGRQGKRYFFGDGRRKHTRANEHRRLYCGGMTNGENRRNMDGRDHNRNDGA